ncbi:MAG: type II toxin-antitoxin system prevent-host-death family antitoxin [Pirellulaceae bacterium]|nr:type II toxin-antitoxin system prevent-host-death family antitoxin [Pirellulaceae bacterium]
MKTASVAEIQSQFSDFLESSAGGPIVVTRNGKPVAVLVGVEDEDEIERLLMAYSPRMRAICDLSRQQIAEGKGISHEQFWAGVEARDASEPRDKSPAKPV